MISARSKRFNNCFLLLYYVCIQLAGVMHAGLMLSTFLWRTSATKWPCTCTTGFLQLDAFFQYVVFYGDIPETHQRKKEGKRLFSCGQTGSYSQTGGIKSSKKCKLFSHLTQ